MMLNFMAYAVVFAAALSVVATCLEYLAVKRGLPRRFAWLLAVMCSMLFPPLLVLTRPAPVATAVTAEAPSMQSALTYDTGLHAVESASALPASAVTTATAATPRTERSWRPAPPSDRSLLMAWAAASGALLTVFCGAGLLLRRRASSWQCASIQKHDLLVSEDTGPALLGVLRPKIVVPRWFMDETADTQRLILEHEEQHIAARDPLLLRTAMLMAIAAPWNLLLWWQLRCLRLAIELDCDARVMRGGAEAGRYGEVLLSVTRRATAMPVGAIAMSEPVSALEQRIRNLAPLPGRHGKWQLIGAVLIGAAGVSAAAALDAPQMKPAAPTPVVQPARPTPAAAATPATPARQSTTVSIATGQPAASQPGQQAGSPVRPLGTQGLNQETVRDCTAASGWCAESRTPFTSSIGSPLNPAGPATSRNNQMEIGDLIDVVARRFHKLFVVDPRVRATVDLASLSADTLSYHAFLEILGVHGFAAVPSADVVTIIPLALATTVASPIVSADRIEGDDSEFVTVIIPIPANVSASGIAVALRQLVGAGGVLNPMSGEPIAGGQSLLLVDKVANAKRIVALVRAQLKAP